MKSASREGAQLSPQEAEGMPGGGVHTCPAGLSQLTSVKYSRAPGAIPIPASSVAASSALVVPAPVVGRGSPAAEPHTCVPCPPPRSSASM